MATIRLYFTSIDKSIYGKYKGITDKEEYTIGFALPEDYNIGTEDQIALESEYHKLTNGGHMTTVELSSKNQGKFESFEKVVKQMKDMGIGLGKIIIK